MSCISAEPLWGGSEEPHLATMSPLELVKNCFFVYYNVVSVVDASPTGFQS